MRFPGAAFLMLFCVSGFAQELWLRPDTYFIPAETEPALVFMSGSGFRGGFATVPREAIAAASLNSTSIASDPLVVYEKERTILRTGKLSAGTHRLVVEVRPQPVQVSADSIRAFLAAYGHDSYQPAEALLLGHQLAVVLQAGEARGDIPRDIGRPGIEIVPDRNPYRLRKGDPLKLTIYRNGTPAFGVRVRIWNRFNNRTTIQNVYTGKDGAISVNISSAGDWMVSVMDLRERNSGAETVATIRYLVFGFR